MASSADARRAQLVLDVKTMRDNGVIVWGDITLGPPPLSKTELDGMKADKADPLAGKRSHYQDLLNKKFSDVELELLP